MYKALVEFATRTHPRIDRVIAKDITCSARNELGTACDPSISKSLILAKLLTFI